MEAGKLSMPAAENYRGGRADGFWDRMADRYPLPFDPKDFADTLQVVSRVKRRGVEIKGALN